MPQQAWVTAKNKKQKLVYLQKIYTKECKSKINQKINPTKEPQLSSSLLGRGNLPQRERSCRTWGVFMGRLHRADDPPFSTCKTQAKRRRKDKDAWGLSQTGPSPLACHHVEDSLFGVTLAVKWSTLTSLRTDFLLSGRDRNCCAVP